MMEQNLKTQQHLPTKKLSAGKEKLSGSTLRIIKIFYKISPQYS